MKKIILVGFLILLICISASTASDYPDKKPTSYVNTFIGTYDSGGTFPGAVIPFGMIQWSPDTEKGSSSSYLYYHNEIRGFSLTHFSGTGCNLYRDITIMPGTSIPKDFPGANWSEYHSTFSHSNEFAGPGWYTVDLDNNAKVELAATARTGLGRFTFNSTNVSVIYINLGDNVDNSYVNIDVSKKLVTGWIKSGGFCGSTSSDYAIYFAAEFDRPFYAYGSWKQNSLIPGSIVSEGKNSGVYMGFNSAQNNTVNMKVGISYISVDNALGNLRSENPGWDIKEVRNNADDVWNDFLGRIKVNGGTKEEKARFYTAFYHSLIHPSTFSDSNGQYIGFDNKIYQDKDHIHYTLFSGWDVYRSQTQLIAILFPDVASDISQSLILDAQQGYGGFPRWTVANSDSGIMIGDPAVPSIANIYAFGARNFNETEALRIMELDSVPGAKSGNKKENPVEIRPNQAEYLKFGYIPSYMGDSVSKTLEYSAADFAAAQYAKALHRYDLYDKFLNRSNSWMNLFNPETGYIQPKNYSGDFISPFDPAIGKGYTEGSGAQYSWMVPFNIKTLFELMGGNSSVISRLDYHASRINGGETSEFMYFGNEPESIVPWLYNWAGAPWKTQELVHCIDNGSFASNNSDIPGLIPGNDDGGQMSAWYVWSALGIYPAIPGVAGFTV
ncbi:MAG: GH92 family glycosyl hydrolase, partial [Candidatus Micrarchaeota archaeon]|nr:GH92 family glycosyl hydrolase [Candidatus Micrarchaeota archaeon]